MPPEEPNRRAVTIAKAEPARPFLNWGRRDAYWTGAKGT